MPKLESKFLELKMRFLSSKYENRRATEIPKSGNIWLRWSVTIAVSIAVLGDHILVGTFAEKIRLHDAYFHKNMYSYDSIKLIIDC